MTTDLKEKPTITEPRLNPIEDPDSIKVKLAYWFTEWKIGKVITPLKVIYARFPEGLGLSKELMALQEKFTIPRRLQHLIKVYTATLNGCAFCIDIGKAGAQNDNMDTTIFENLMRFEERDHFTKAEKTALSYIDEATRHKHVSDSTYRQLEQNFNDREIAQITLLNAIENFYNLVNAPMNIGSDELCELWN